MADGILVAVPASGVTIASDELTGATSTLAGNSHKQYIGVMDGVENSANKWKIQSDGAAVFVADTAAAPTVTRVASAAASTMLKAANANRRGLIIFNESQQYLYVRFGAAAASYVDYSFQLEPGGSYEMSARPIITTQINGIWAAVDGAAQVTEIL